MSVAGVTALIAGLRATGRTAITLSDLEALQGALQTSPALAALPPALHDDRLARRRALTAERVRRYRARPRTQ